MEDFTARLTALLAANPRIEDNGCALVLAPHGVRPRWVPTTEPYTPTPEEVERIYRLTLFIERELPINPRGNLRVGSYNLKHVLEKTDWKEGPNTYVSNTEGMLAMMMCGYVPRWSKDPQDPNCVFSVRAKTYTNMAMSAYRRFNERRQRPNPPR